MHLQNNRFDRLIELCVNEALPAGIAVLTSTCMYLTGAWTCAPQHCPEKNDKYCFLVSRNPEIKINMRPYEFLLR